MTKVDISDAVLLLRRMPSMKSLFFFNVVARHQNLVRAGQELHLSQGALSRQIKALEQHLGIELFRRTPRGLAFTQEGETLYAYTEQAFGTLTAGLQRLSLVPGPQTLVVSVARSFAVCVLAPRLAQFVQAHPWVNLQIDTHRYFADLETSGADVSIRLSEGEFTSGYRHQVLTDDACWLVATPAVAKRLRSPDSSAGALPTVLLRNSERDDWTRWVAAGNHTVAHIDTSLQFNDSATMLQTAKAGVGFCVARAALVQEAIKLGTLERVWKQEMRDGLCYRAVSTARSKPALEPFLSWLAQEFEQN
jgi:DNA-binding transcriptional LysR family regulator